MSEEMKLSNERLAEMVGAGVPCVPAQPGEIAAVVQELRALRASSGVEVKGLVWVALEAARSDEDPRTEETGDYEAITPFGSYMIEAGFGSDEYVWSLYFNGLPAEGVWDTDDPEKLRITAEADYRQRILSCLSSPLPTVEVTGALIDAGAHALEHGTDLSLSWEEFCTVSELVLRSALSQNKGEE